MNLLLRHPTGNPLTTTLKITGSKSESNRLLLLQALYPSITIANSSNSDDSAVMQHAVSTAENTIDIHHAGTAMRFLTAFFALQQGRAVTLTGSERMKQRPIGILVDALRQLGADIRYTEKEGYPPLHIRGRSLKGNNIIVQAGISSQYISALLLIAPKLPGGLNITLEGNITSVPYIKMTLTLLHKIGVKTSFNGNTISVQPLRYAPQPRTITVESDWSSASYFYSIVALSTPGTRITLASYRENSLQGDAALATIYKKLGVATHYIDTTIILIKNPDLQVTNQLTLDLANTPDIAQTLAVSCFGLGTGCTLSGLHTLRIKETDRLEALKTELSKLGATVTVTDKVLWLQPSNTIREHCTIKTYEDHRMAMAFAPLALKAPLIINNAEVVSKSYPGFWKDLEQLGFTGEKQ